MIYQSRATAGDLYKNPTYSLRALLYAISLVALFCALPSQLGAAGIVLAWDTAWLSFLIIHWVQPHGFPAGMYRNWKDSEWGTVMVATLLMHVAILLPSVQMCTRPRAPLPATPAAPVVPAQPGSPTNAS